MKFLIRARLFLLAFGLAGLFFQGMNTMSGLPMDKVRAGITALDVVALVLGVLGFYWAASREE